MSQLRIYGVTLAALVAACVGFALIALLNPYIWWELFIPVLEALPEYVQVICQYGLSALVGAPFNFTVTWQDVFINSLSWGAWAALAYAMILRIGFRAEIHWGRLVILYLWTAILAYIMIYFVLSDIIRDDIAFLFLFALWLFTGLFIVRDWVVRP